MLESNALLRLVAISALFGSFCLPNAIAQDAEVSPSSEAKTPTSNKASNAKAMDPETLRNRTWTWEEGTKFGDGAHTITIAGNSCTLGPTLNAYRIKQGTKLESSVAKAWLGNSLNVSITSEPDGKHMIAENEAPKEVCFVKFDFKSLKIKENGARLEMQGTCSYEILLYYQGKGKEKAHFKMKEEGVSIVFTSRKAESSRPFSGRYGLRDATLLPDVNGGFEALAKRMLAENDGNPFLAFKAIKDERDKLWQDEAGYREELVLADHYLTAYASQFPGSGLILDLATTTPGIIAYEGIKAGLGVLGQTVNPQHPLQAPQSPPSLRAIEAAMQGRYDGYVARHGQEPPRIEFSSIYFK
jgi:hypothetical protein